MEYAKSVDGSPNTVIAAIPHFVQTLVTTVQLVMWGILIGVIWRSISRMYIQSQMEN